MAPIQNLPVEIKLEILRKIDSRQDLTAISSTCHEFYSIRKSKLWEFVNWAVLRNETERNTSAELLSLLLLRRAKAEQLNKKLCPHAQPEVKPCRHSGEFSQDDILDLFELRQTIRWFTKQFVNYQGWQKSVQYRTKVSEPSRTELKRVNDAFCLFWLWAEASYDLMQRRKADMNWLARDFIAVQPFPPASPDLGTVYSVYSYLLCRLASLGPQYVQSLSIEYLESLLDGFDCFNRSITKGLSNLLLTSLDLNDIRDLLEQSTDERLQTVGRHFHKLEMSSWEIDHDDHHLVNHFVYRLDFESQEIHSYPESSKRPLWVHAYGHYRLRSPPWEQYEGFQWDSTFWDDERLINWGYFAPLEVDCNIYPNKLKLLGSQFTASCYGCTRCPPEWPCVFRTAGPTIIYPV